jgi:hypothetical protein
VSVGNKTYKQITKNKITTKKSSLESVRPIRLGVSTGTSCSIGSNANATKVAIPTILNPLKLDIYKVRQANGLKISDHLLCSVF